MTRPVPELITGRPVTMAPSGMVTSPHALASEVGVAALRAGGSAVDAAIATSAALSVLYPHMCGVGGDAFWLIYEATSGRVRYLDGAGLAAGRGTIEAFAARGLKEVPFRGALPATLTTPGAVASWCAAHAAFGRRPLADNLHCAIELARAGFPVTERLARWTALVLAEGALNESAQAIFAPAGAAPRAGALLRNVHLSRTLERIAADGHAGFYAGDTATALAAFARDQAGFFNEEDLKQQIAAWGEPICSTYRDVTLYETPPPTQGLCVLEMLNILEAFDVGAWDFMGPDHVHHLVQAKQIAYNDRDHLLADPARVAVPTQHLISKAYAKQRRALMDPERALPWDRVPSYGSLRGDTVYVATVDAQGNAASLIHSLYGVFGSGEVAPGTGIVLQNRGAYFSLDALHPNCLQPGKKPLHTLIASMAVRDDKLWSVLGCMGADGQPQIHLQAYVAMIDYGLDIQQAVEMPRWLSGRFALGEPRDLLNIEGGFAAATIDELQRRGHRVNRWQQRNELAGHAHGITIDRESGVRMGAADPRSDGAAVGY
ncbi:MAG: gamma-glutamyltranspeptidase [Gammaproteobacteria bacterium]|jgi:gamma-glutamyltranspeptidase